MFEKYLFNFFDGMSDNYRAECIQSNSNTVFGIRYCTEAILSGKYGIPKIKAYHDTIPQKFITYSESSTSSDYSCGVSSFDEDLFLERIWKNADKYISTFSKFHCICEPDFSLKIGHPLAIQITNTYRNHALAFHMQSQGLKVMPTISWSSIESFDFCFDGHEKGGAVIVSTIGTLRDKRSAMFFRLGFEEMIKRISPDAVVIYGDTNESLLDWMPKQLHVRFVSHNRYQRARNHGRKRSI